jgi:Mg2+/Co2+ transporter CorB
MFINYILGAIWVASYILAALVSSIKLRLPNSVYKIKLNNQQGQKDAAKWLWYWENRSAIHSLIKIKKGFIYVIFITTTIIIFGNILGFLVASLMMIIIVRLDNFKLVKQLGDKLFWWLQPKIVKPLKLVSRYLYKFKFSKKDEDGHTPPVSSVNELLDIIRFNHSNLPAIEYYQLINLLTIQDIKIHDIMLPKNRIAFINQDDILTQN